MADSLDSIMTYGEYTKLHHEVPYIFEIDKEDKKLTYFGSRHTHDPSDPMFGQIEERFKETLGTRVHIERSDTGGKVMIDFFSAEDLRGILERMGTTAPVPDMLERHIKKTVQKKENESKRTGIFFDEYKNRHKNS